MHLATRLPHLAYAEQKMCDGFNPAWLPQSVADSSSCVFCTIILLIVKAIWESCGIANLRRYQCGLVLKTIIVC